MEIHVWRVRIDLIARKTILPSLSGSITNVIYANLLRNRNILREVLNHINYTFGIFVVFFYWKHWRWVVRSFVSCLGALRSASPVRHILYVNDIIPGHIGIRLSMRVHIMNICTISVVMNQQIPRIAALSPCKQADYFHQTHHRRPVWKFRENG